MAADDYVMWGQSTAPVFQAVDPEEQVRVFRTGDLGRLSCQGLLLAGRLDLQAKIGGALQCAPRTRKPWHGLGVHGSTCRWFKKLPNCMKASRRPQGSHLFGVQV